MPFKVVQTFEGKKNKLFTVPSSWEADNILRYPKKAPSKYIKDQNSIPTTDWDVIKCKVKRRNVLSYEAGERQVSEMMKYSDTDDDNHPQVQRPEINQTSLNLNLAAEKLVGNVVSTNYYTPVIPSTSANSTNEFTYEVAYFEEPQATSTISSELLSDNPYQVSSDNSEILKNQNLIINNQANILSQMLENKREITGQIQSLINVQNNLIKKVSGLSVQLEDAVAQITAMPLLTLDKSKGVIENIPVHIKPIDSVQNLDELEKQLTIKDNRNRLKNTYSVLCSGGKAIDCAYLLVDIMFSRKFICQCSWSGGSRGENLKVPLKGYKHVLSFFWEMVHSWNEKYTLNDNEIFFKTILKNSHKRKLAKLERASTSRIRSKRTKSHHEEDIKTSKNNRDSNTNKNEVYDGESKKESQKIQPMKDKQDDDNESEVDESLC